MNTSYPYPYVVVGLNSDGSKRRKKAPFNTAREEARRKRRMQRGG